MYVHVRSKHNTSPSKDIMPVPQKKIKIAKKVKTVSVWQCPHCDISPFKQKHLMNNHIDVKHKCPICHELLPDADQTLQHEQKHQRERDEKIAKEKYNDNVYETYIVPKSIHQYTECDSKLDVEYLMRKYGDMISGEDIAYFITNFHFDFDACIECANDDQIQFLFEHKIITAEYLQVYVDLHLFETGLHYYMLEQFSEPIPAFTVANAIVLGAWDDDFMEALKEKYNYQFREIYEIIEDSGWNMIINHYSDVHRWFPDPDYKSDEDPDYDSEEEFPEWHEPIADYGAPEAKQFSSIVTEHARDHLHNQYCYDEIKDILWVKISSNDARLNNGHCKQLKNEDLYMLIGAYKQAIRDYESSNKEVQQAFADLENMEYGDRRDYFCEDISSKSVRQRGVETVFYD